MVQSQIYVLQIISHNYKSKQFWQSITKINKYNFLCNNDPEKFNASNQALLDMRNMQKKYFE